MSDDKQNQVEKERKDEKERIRRWRLALGVGSESGAHGAEEFGLSADDLNMDNALSLLYDDDERSKKAERSAGLGASSPRVARWLGDIRKYFPTTVVSVMQKDAMEKLNLKSMLTEPELLSTLTPDINLVATLAALSSTLPSKSKSTARLVVKKVTDELSRRLSNPMRQAVAGALNKAKRNNRPRHSEMDWNRTIRLNLKHYQPQFKTVIPERRVGFSRKRSSLKDIIMLVDQSGSMATSVVYASIYAAVLASISALNTKLVVFDTAVVDLSDKLSDPVDIIFGTQLGGGTDINSAVGYVETLITRPNETILVLISDLFEGGNQSQLKKKLLRLKGMGVNLIALLALNDDGAPAFNPDLAAFMAQIDAPAFACTPDQFPEVMALALNQGDIAGWIAREKQ
ncbi:MAG: VWA domain-containing protein [Candidatus Obscuribacter phosphatis]|uniref:VWA domain-containing protein n=1 Tax=Candidatus Obscuribacter phosphatis TaxID=1906157 RepID=A0A8J7PH63_9BACT|nr:VWA domain-containing protein [Candidatus Obscuribacter phosphatis]